MAATHRKRIWLVRHGQSRSQTGESDDHLDPELSDLGVEQARRLATPLCELPVDAILISPLRRAWQTWQFSQVVAGHIEFNSRLIESDWGSPDRYVPILPLTTPDTALPDRQDAWLEGVQARADALVAELLAEDQQNVLLFGHWGMFGHLFLAFAGMGEGLHGFRMTMDNAGISLLEVDPEGNRFVRYWNDRAHVRDLAGGER